MNIYIAKYSSNIEYERVWDFEGQINEKIGSSYFILGLTKCQIDHKSHEKITLVSFKKLKIDNVKLHSKSEDSSSEDYFDIKNSVEFYEMDSKVDSSKKKIYREPELCKFSLKPSDHFCVEEIFRISQN